MPSSNTNTTDDLRKTQLLIAGAYIRVSTKRQEDEETEEVQIADVKAQAATDCNILSEENIFIDRNWTGGLLKRPALDQMRTAALAGKFQILYAYDRGRIARKYSYQEIVIEELEDRNIRFVPLHDKEIKNDEDRLLQGVQGLFHEWERYKIAERFRIAKLRRAEGGRLINGHALYGYKIMRNPGQSGEKKDEQREYAINEEEAHVVRLIFSWFVDERASLRQIIERLFTMKIPPRKRKQACWTKGPLLRLLTCDTYVKGKVYFNKHEACIPKNPTNKSEYRRVKKSSHQLRPREEWIEYPVPTILPDDGVFEKAQALLEENKRRKAKNRKSTYLMSGLVWCGCGHRRVGDAGGNGNHYYRCAQRVYRHPKPSECTLPGINAAAMDIALWEKIKQIMSNPKVLRESAELDIQERQQGDRFFKEAYELNELIKKAKSEQERYAKAYGADEMPFEQYRKFNRDVERRIKSYEAQIQNIEKESIEPTDNIDQLCAAATKVLRLMADQDKELLISHVVKKVVIYREDVELQIHIPLPSSNLSVKVPYRAKSRDSRTAKRRQINFI